MNFADILARNLVPALSGLALPLFLLLDAFIGRSKYTSFLGVEAVHLRRWLPLNIRAFITAVENHYKVPEFVKAHGCPKLNGVLEGIIESYAGMYLGMINRVHLLTAACRRARLHGYTSIQSLRLS